MKTKHQKQYVARLKNQLFAKQAASALPAVMKAVDGLKPEAARRVLTAALILIQ